MSLCLIEKFDFLRTIVHNFVFIGSLVMNPIQNSLVVSPKNYLYVDSIFAEDTDDVVAMSTPKLAAINSNKGIMGFPSTLPKILNGATLHFDIIKANAFSWIAQAQAPKALFLLSTNMCTS